MNIDGKTTATVSSESSSESSVQNERLAAFLQILFAKPSYDMNDELSQLIPVTLSDDLQEIITATSKVWEHTLMISDSIDVLADDVKKKELFEQSFKLPFPLSHSHHIRLSSASS